MSLTDNARLTRTGDDSYSAQSDPEYWNLIGPFGGWIAAVMLRAVLEDPRHAGDPLSLGIQFAGALEPGPFALRLRELRHNRSTTFWAVDLVQEQDGAEQLCAFATIVTALGRPTPAFVEIARPSVAEPEDLKSFAGPNVMTLPFLGRFDMRYAGEGLFPADASSELTMWAKVRDAGSFDFEALTALCDVGLPNIFGRLKKRVPVSSVTMNVFYHAPGSELANVGDDFVLSNWRMRAAVRGFFDKATTVWTRSGTLLATTEQVLWFKSPG